MSKKNKMIPVYCLDSISEEGKQIILENMVEYWIERKKNGQKNSGLF